MIKNDGKKGIVLWQGKSLLDNNRIMVIATGVLGKSKNEKTGEMIQTWILRRDVHPMTARRMGEDFSICGDCMHRENSTCYVNLCHGPINIFYAYLDGTYKHFEDSDIEHFRGRNIRIGSYGDPAAVPFEVWEKITKVANSFTGYTHQWNNPNIDNRLKTICMASVDTIKGFTVEYNLAQAKGWRTFRVRESAENILFENEFACPASKEGGEKVQCNQCRACGGLSSKTSKSVSIMLHADTPELGNWRLKRYLKIMKQRKNKKAWRRNYVKERKIYESVCRF